MTRTPRHSGKSQKQCQDCGAPIISPGAKKRCHDCAYHHTRTSANAARRRQKAQPEEATP